MTTSEDVFTSGIVCICGMVGIGIGFLHDAFVVVNEEVIEGPCDLFGGGW